MPEETYNTLLIKAQKYFSFAEESEKLNKKTKDPNAAEEALKYYLKAADAFMAASSKCPKSSQQDNLIRSSQYCYTKYENLSGKEQSKLRINGSSEEFSAKKFDFETPKTSWKDVGGMEGLKKEITKEIIWPIIESELYKVYISDHGAKGILMYGPPGCGKSYIAEAAAGEAKAKYIRARGSDLKSELMGATEKNIRGLFEQAAKESENSPVILFIDELDYIGKKRTASEPHLSGYLNEVLVAFEMLANKNVLVLGATNAPWLLDPALTREDRIGTHIYVGPPDKDARIQIFKYRLSKTFADKSIDCEKLADLTDLFTSSDIKGIVKRAAEQVMDEVIATRQKRVVNQNDLERVIKTSEPKLYEWCKDTRTALGDDIVRYSDLCELVERVLGQKIEVNQ